MISVVPSLQLLLEIDLDVAAKRTIWLTTILHHEAQSLPKLDGCLRPLVKRHASPSENERVSKAATSNTRRRISRATGNKRCDNTQLKQDYGWSLKAPTYREGLALLLKNSDLKL